MMSFTHKEKHGWKLRRRKDGDKWRDFVVT
jgi:hypothetical protein